MGTDQAVLILSTAKEYAASRALGAAFKDFLKATGMIRIIVGEPYPLQVLRIDDRIQRFHKLLAVYAHSCINKDWLLRLNDEGIDRKKSRSGNRKMSGKNLDIWLYVIWFVQPEFDTWTPFWASLPTLTY
jgi:hypothetical protein